MSIRCVALRFSRYYILSDGNIYQAPNMLNVMSNRLENCAFRLNRTFEKLRKAVRFAPTQGHTITRANLAATAEDSGDSKVTEKESDQQNQGTMFTLSEPNFTLKRRRYQKHELQRITNNSTVNSILEGLAKKVTSMCVPVPPTVINLLSPHHVCYCLWVLVHNRRFHYTC